MSIITFGGINKSLLYIILAGVLKVLNQYTYGFIYIGCLYQMNFYRILYNAIIDSNKTDFPRHRVFDTLFSYIGVIILSYCISQKNNKDEHEDLMESKLELNLIHEDTYNYFETQNSMFVLIKIIILWVIEENLLLIFVDIFQDLDFSCFELIFISIIFSKKFYFKLYAHQIIGIAISVGVSFSSRIYNLILSMTSEQKEEDKTFYQRYPLLFFFILLYLLLILLRSYVNTQIKILMDLKFVTSRALLIFYGIIGFFMCLLAGIFTSFVPCFDFINNYVCKMNYGDKMYYDHFLNYIESWQNILVRLIVILLGAITFFFDKYYCIMIIQNYTPIHPIFSFFIQYFIEKTFLLIFTPIFFPDDFFPKRNQFKKFLLDESVDIASIIGLLIYLEMIELNFCGLNFNLKKNIIIRGKEEYKNSLKIKRQIKEGNFSSFDDEGTEF